jgi:hypothetical protein
VGAGARKLKRENRVSVTPKLKTMSITILYRGPGKSSEGKKDDDVVKHLKGIPGLELCDIKWHAGEIVCDVQQPCIDKGRVCRLFKCKIEFDGMNLVVKEFTALDKDHKLTADDKGFHFVCQCCEVKVKKITENSHGLKISETGHKWEDEDLSGSYPEVNTKCKLSYIEGSSEIAGIEFKDPGLWIFCEQEEACDQGECELVRLETDGTELKPSSSGAFTKDNPYKVDFEKDKDCIFVCACSKPPLKKRPHHKPKKK